MSNSTFPDFFYCYFISLLLDKYSCWCLVIVPWRNNFRFPWTSFQYLPRSYPVYQTPPNHLSCSPPNCQSSAIVGRYCVSSLFSAEESKPNWFTNLKINFYLKKMHILKIPPQKKNIAKAQHKNLSQNQFKYISKWNKTKYISKSKSIQIYVS